MDFCINNHLEKQNDIADLNMNPVSKINKSQLLEMIQDVIKGDSINLLWKKDRTAEETEYINAKPQQLVIKAIKVMISSLYKQGDIVLVPIDYDNLRYSEIFTPAYENGMELFRAIIFGHKSIKVIKG